MLVHEPDHALAEVFHRVVECTVLRIGVDTRNRKVFRTDHGAVGNVIYLQRIGHLGLVVHLAVDIRLELRERNVVGLSDDDLLGAQRLVGGFAFALPVGIVHHVLDVAVGIEFRQRTVGQCVDDVETATVGKTRQDGRPDVVTGCLADSGGVRKRIDDDSLLRRIVLGRGAQPNKHGHSGQNGFETVFHKYS